MKHNLVHSYQDDCSGGWQEWVEMKITEVQEVLVANVTINVTFEERDQAETQL